MTVTLSVEMIVSTTSVDVDQESFDNNIGIVQEDENVSQMYQIK